MADEITYNVVLSCRNGSFDFTRSVSNTIDQNTVGGAVPGTQSIGTTHELVDVLADLTAEGYFIATNLDTTNFVEIGVDVSATFYPLIRLKAGESSMGRLSPGVAVYAKADTAACQLQFQCLED